MMAHKGSGSIAPLIINLATMLWSAVLPSGTPQRRSVRFGGSMHIKGEKNGMASPHIHNSKIGLSQFPSRTNFCIYTYSLPLHYFLQIESIMAHYIRPLHFHLHTSLILLLHRLSYSSPSSYSNTSIHLLCFYFVIYYSFFLRPI